MNTITQSQSLTALYYQNRLNQATSTKTTQSLQSDKTQQNDPLADLVASGEITKEQEEAVYEALQQNVQPPPSLMQSTGQENPLENTLSDLVDDGTITESQRTAVAQALDSARTSAAQDTSGEELFSDVLDSLLEDGTITEDQKDAILEAVDNAMQKAPAPPPRGGAVPKEISDSLSSLVSDDTITEEQEDAILNALTTYEPGQDETKSPLEQLVEDGTITEEQKDKIQASIQNSMKLKQAQSAYGSAAGFSSQLNELITTGVLSDEQAQSVNQALLSGLLYA